MSSMEQQLAAANAEIELLEQKLQTSQSNERNVQSELHDNERMLRKVQRELAAGKFRANTSSHAGSSSGHEKHEPDVEKLREESQSGGRIQFADTAFSPWSSKDPWRSIHSYTPAPSTGFGSGSLLVPLEKAKPTVMSKPTLFSAPMANQSPRKAGCGETRPMAAPSLPALPASTDLFLSRSQNPKLEPSSSTASIKLGQPKQRPLEEETKTAGSIKSAVSVPKSPIDAKSYTDQRPLRDDSNVSGSPPAMEDVKDGQPRPSHRGMAQNIPQSVSKGVEAEAENEDSDDSDEDSDDSEVIARNVRVSDVPDWLKPGCKGRYEKAIRNYVKPSILDSSQPSEEIKDDRSRSSHRGMAQNVAQVISEEAEIEAEDEDSDDSEVIARNFRLGADVPDWMKPGWKGPAEKPIPTCVKPSIPDPPESPKEIKDINSGYDITDMDGEFGTKYNKPFRDTTLVIQPLNSMGLFDDSTKSVYKHGPTGKLLENPVSGVTDTSLATSNKRPMIEPFVSQSSKRSKPGPSDHQ